MTKLSGTILDGASRPWWTCISRSRVSEDTGTGPRSRLLLFVAAGLLIGSSALSAPPAQAKTGSAKAIAAAVADPARPAADRDRDALRKPAACLAFAGVRPGMTMAELFPGKGYFTRIFSRAVGSKGHVYAIEPPPRKPGTQPATRAIAADPHYQNNITVVQGPIATFQLPRPVDLVWTSQNYHDLHNIPGFSVPDFNRRVYDSLKPGGIYLVLDHAAPAGSGFSDTSTLHRIDPEAARKEIMAAGFEFVGESNLLRNPNDPRTKLVFDPSIRGHTDQFIFKFRKPK